MIYINGIPMTEQAISFYHWSGWVQYVKGGDVKQIDIGTVPHVACLLLLAGF